jgi:ADP-ribosylglycohydrolase
VLRILGDECRTINDGCSRSSQIARRRPVADQQVSAAVREILKHMAKWEGCQESVNLALEVFKAQQDVNKATSRAIRKRLEGIFSEEARKP